MSNSKEPDYGNGKICYIEIPTKDITVSEEFYKNSFGWKTRKRTNGSVAFDDGVGQVSGTWVLGRKPMEEAGLMVYIMVDDIETTMALIEGNGGTIVQLVGADHPEITARFIDPMGNVLGLYQQP